jgi:cytochrome b
MQTEPARTATEVKVWDPLVRIFHWSLVIAFATAYITGEEETRAHDWAGYVVLGLIAFRILWGFVGTRHARFADFVYAPRTVLGYARDFVTGRARRYLGHNPLGGVMILALLASLAATGVTGWQLEQAEKAGQAAAANTPALAALLPIATAYADDDKDEGDEHEGGTSEDALEEFHEFFAHLTLLLVALHVAGVIAGSLLHRENLVRAMFTGRKSV